MELGRVLTEIVEFLYGWYNIATLINNERNKSTIVNLDEYESDHDDDHEEVQN